MGGGGGGGGGVDGAPEFKGGAGWKGAGGGGGGGGGGGVVYCTPDFKWWAWSNGASFSRNIYMAAKAIACVAEVYKRPAVLNLFLVLC